MEKFIQRFWNDVENGVNRAKHEYLEKHRKPLYGNGRMLQYVAQNNADNNEISYFQPFSLRS